MREKLAAFNARKRLDLVLLCSAWAVLYAPYIVFGGFVIDDWGYVAKPREFQHYADFQWWFSSLSVATARPVSALLQGFAYWFLGPTPWMHHLVNLGLFGGAILLFYAALANIVACELAFLSTFAALVYPCASGAIFSSLTMNCNLAAISWSGALYLDSMARQTRWKDALAIMLLLSSALSYEAFIPLFAANILIRLKRFHSMSWNAIFRAGAPVMLTMACFAFYHTTIQAVIFGDSFTRLALPLEPGLLVQRVYRTFVMGIKVGFLHSLHVSIKALANLTLLSLPAQLALGALLLLCGVALYRCFSISASVASAPRPVLEWWIQRYTTLRIGGIRYLDEFAVGSVLFLFAHIIFILSRYAPTAYGYESRTQISIRFAFGFLLAGMFKIAYDVPVQRFLKWLVAVSAVGLLSLFSLSIVGQREAWIEAARYNARLLTKIDRALQDAHVQEQKAWTLVAEIPQTFPHQINGEPLFQEFWDFGAALALLYPNHTIRANVYRTKKTAAHADRIVIQGYWEAFYPFYFYRFATDRVSQIHTEQEWETIVGEL